MAGEILWAGKPPTSAEISERQAADAQKAAELAAIEAEEREFRLMKKILRLMHRRHRGEITQAQYIAQTDAILAAFQGA